jgi:Tol biopolymer transport system component
MDGNVFRYWPFGRWELTLADFEERDGIPRYTNLRNITPKDMPWNEPGNFAPDSVSLLLSGSVEKDAQGMDQYILNIKSGKLTNLTNSPKVWDEHGRFSPDGEKIIFMSAYPYRADPKASQVLTIKTEFMLMSKDGSELTQLTRFREPGSPQYPSGIAANPEWHPDGRSASLAALVFPKYEYWEVAFQGACGNGGVRNR